MDGQFPHFNDIVFQGLRLHASTRNRIRCVFKKFKLWRAFPKVCGCSVRFCRIRVDKSRIRKKMFADTNESGYVWTGPQTLIVFYFRDFIPFCPVHLSHWRVLYYVKRFTFLFTIFLFKSICRLLLLYKLV